MCWKCQSHPELYGTLTSASVTLVRGYFRENAAGGLWGQALSLRLSQGLAVLWGFHTANWRGSEGGAASPWIPAGVGDVPRVHSTQGIPAWEAGSVPEPYWGIRSFKTCPGCAPQPSPCEPFWHFRHSVTARGLCRRFPRPRAPLSLPLIPAEPGCVIVPARVGGGFRSPRTTNCLLCVSLLLKPST